MNKFEKAIAESMLAISALATGTEVIEKDFEKMVQTWQKVKQVEQSATQGGLTPKQAEELKKQRDELLNVLSDPKLHKKLNFAQKQQVEAIKSEAYKIFPINQPIHFTEKK